MNNLFLIPGSTNSRTINVVKISARIGSPDLLLNPNHERLLYNLSLHNIWNTFGAAKNEENEAVNVEVRIHAYTNGLKNAISPIVRFTA